MSTLRLSPSFLEVGIRWAARLLATLLVGLVVVIYVGQGGFNPLKLKAVELTQMIFLWTACIGMVVAWRWQVLGGALSLGGMILFFTVEVAMNGRLPRGLFLYLLLVPGILFLLSGLFRRSRAS
jgi:hypothetical protein